MKYTKYTVTFDTGQVEVIAALCIVEATILAQARQIEKGNCYNVVRVERNEQ